MNMNFISKKKRNERNIKRYSKFIHFCTAFVIPHFITHWIEVLMDLRKQLRSSEIITYRMVYSVLITQYTS